MTLTSSAKTLKRYDSLQKDTETLVIRNVDICVVLKGAVLLNNIVEIRELLKNLYINMGAEKVCDLAHVFQF